VSLTVKLKGADTRGAMSPKQLIEHSRGGGKFFWPQGSVASRVAGEKKKGSVQKTEDGEGSVLISLSNHQLRRREKKITSDVQLKGKEEPRAS